MSWQQLAQDLCQAGSHIYTRGLIAAYEGNLSARRSVRDREFLITPAGSCKGMLKARDLKRMALDGKPDPALRVSSEWPMHQLVYQLRPSALAVVHVHAPHATAFACTRGGLKPLLVAELIQLLGGPVPLADFADPGSQALALALRPHIAAGHRAILLANHGLICISDKSPLDACLIAEQVEQVARSTFLALQLGDLNELDPAALRHLKP
jgi:ribulose-5-phosphate 4-epimerase/fuculose-1-phosphate aldolase